jgi:hypothetical protein
MKKWRKVAVGRMEERCLYKLRLAPIAVRRHHETARDLVCDFSSEVSPNNVQAQVNSGRAARRG